MFSKLIELSFSPDTINKSLFGCRKFCQRIRNGKGKMESRGNDKRVKFVGPTISVRWREKTCGPMIYVNDHITP